MDPWRTCHRRRARRAHPNSRLRPSVPDDGPHLHRHDLSASSGPAAVADRARAARRHPHRSRRSRIRRAVVRHGASRRCPAIGSRVSAAVAAGILAVGDDHGGAGLGCMEHDCRRRRAARKRSRSRWTRRRSGSWPTRGRAASASPASDIACTRPIRARRILFDLARAAAASPATASPSSTRWRRAIAAAVKPLPINIDGALAAVLHDMGFTPVFGRLVFHHRPRRRPHRGSRGGAVAREADAHPHSRGLRRRGPA